ncbi:MAG TPA: DinB family protein [Bryobacteraceae bacterium]|nr:DinB family protein [Bryobacteraceae bacterium]
MVRLDAILDSWKTVRADTATTVEDFPADKFDYKPCPDVMTFGEIARHILIAGHGLTGLLLEGEEMLGGPQFREKMARFVVLPESAGAADLARELRASVEQRAVQLAAQPAEFYTGMITRVDGARVTRLEMLQFVKEHELTHRQQLFLYARMNGIVPATTRRRLAKQAAR